MSSTQRTKSVNIEICGGPSEDGAKNSTQLIERVLLSSSSSSSRNKLQTQSTTNMKGNNHNNSTHQHLMMMQQDDNSVGTVSQGGGVHGGQYTYRGVGFNNTGKNWRKLITPAHDSFKKLQKQQPDYSAGGLGGSKELTSTQQNDLNHHQSNDTSIESSVHLSIKEFNPNGYATAQQSVDTNEEEFKHSDLKSRSQLKVNVPQLSREEALKQSAIEIENLDASALQMQSLMKSFSNGNFQFYENLHKKYFDKAKGDDKSSNKPPTSSQMKSSLNEKDDVFTLTSKTGTILGLSQLKQSITSLKEQSQIDKPSILRASSLKGKSQLQSGSNPQQNTMSINFKNSLFKRVTGGSVFFEDDHNSQIQVSQVNKSSLMRRKRVDYFDTSSSSSEELNLEEEDQHEKISNRQAIDIHSHVKRQKREVLGAAQERRRDRSYNPSHLMFEDLTGDKQNSILSRRDLSANNDETHNSFIEIKTPRDFLKEFQQSRRAIDKRQPQMQQQRLASKTRLAESQISHNSHLLAMSENHQQKMSLIQSSLQLSGSGHPDDFTPQHHHDRTDIILEPQQITDNRNYHPFAHITRGEVVISQDEEMMHSILEKAYRQSLMQSSQSSSQNDVLKTFQEQCKLAKMKLVPGENGSIQHTNQKKQSQQNSGYDMGGINATPALNNMNSDKQSIPRTINQINKSLYQMQSAAPVNRQNPLLQQSSRADILTTNAKKGGSIMHHANSGHNLHNHELQQDQRSDFTFVLSNPTDFNMECQCQNPNLQESFITQKHAKLLQNSEALKQSKGQLRNRLPEIAASPIYSESGQLPTGNIVNYKLQCHNCGGCKKSQEGPLVKERIGGNRSSYNNLHHDSIKEESQDEDEEHLQQFHPENKMTSRGRVFEYPSTSRHPQTTSRDRRPYDGAPLSTNSAVKSGSTYIEELITHRLMNGQYASQSLQEEVKFLRLLLTVSYEQMVKLINEDNLKEQQYQDLERILNLIYPRILTNYNPSEQNNNLQQSQYSQNDHDNQDNTNNNNDDQKQYDGNMTMSELRLQNEQQEKPVDSSKMSELVIVENIPTSTDRQPIRKQQKLKSSLISGVSSKGEDENTVYSYLEEEERNTDDQCDDEDLERHHEREDYHKMRHSRHASSIHQATDLRKSLRNTKHSLQRTRQLLNQERNINRQQEDQLKRMQAEIEALTQKWKMTEDKIRSGEQMYNILSRTTTPSMIGVHQNPHYLSMANISKQPHTPPPQTSLNAFQGTATTNTSNTNPSIMQNLSLINKDPISPLLVGGDLNKKHFLSHNNLIATQASSDLSNPTLRLGSNHHNVMILDTSQTSNTIQSSSTNKLIDINDRLTKQIEDNLSVFENLNREISNKDHALITGEVKLTEKDKELRRLKSQIKNMNENMQRLIQVTQMTSEATEVSKIQHIQEMEKIKKRQEEYQIKMQRIQKAFESGTQSMTTEELEIGTANKTQATYKLKYASSRGNLGKSPDEVQSSSNQTSQLVQDEELSIGQIRGPQSTLKKDTQVDFIPSRLKPNEKENLHPNILANDEQNFSDFYAQEDSSALLKYSNDQTGMCSQLATSLRQYSGRIRQQ